MPGLIEHWADQVVHGGVHDDVATGAALFDVDHAGHQDAGVADQQAAGLEDQVGAQAPRRLAHDRGVFAEVGRRLALVGDAEAAAEIEPAQGVPLRAQLPIELGQAPEGLPVGREVGQLRADMNRQAFQRDAGQVARPREAGRRLVDVDTELVTAPSGGDVGVGAGVDVGIDPDRHRRPLSPLHGDLVQQLQFGPGLDVDLQDAEIERQAQFPRGLADPGEDDLLGRDPRGQGPLQLAFGDHVGAAAQGGQGPHQGQVAVGLEGVADR